MVFQWLDSRLIIQRSSNTNSLHAHILLRRAFDKGPSEHLSVELLIAAKGQAEGDHLFGVNRAAFNFIISCTAALILCDPPPPNVLAHCIHTYSPHRCIHRQNHSPSPLYVQLVVLSRSAYAILVNNWLDTFEKGVKIHVLIGDQ